MAKKARRKLDEDEEYKGFRFPEFDEGKFLAHEFEQSIAGGLSIGMAIVLGFACWFVDRVAPVFVAPLVGSAGLILSPFLIQRLRPLSAEYTRGEWAGLIAMELFGWLGIWFLLVDVLPS